MDQIEEEKHSKIEQTPLQRLTKSNDILAEIFSFIPGHEVIHKVALLSKRVREILIKSKQRFYHKVTLKVGPTLIQPKLEKGLFSIEKSQGESITYQRLGINCKAYKAILKIANIVRLICTNENYSNILQVIQVLHAFASTDEKKQEIHILYKTNISSFPHEIIAMCRQIEYDRKETGLITFLTETVHKNYDFSVFKETAFKTVSYYETENSSFPRLEKAGKFPNCLTMKLKCPLNLKGMDFSSLTQLKRLEVSFDKNSDLEKSESELRLLFNLLLETPEFSTLKIEAASLNVQTFVELVNQQEKNRNVKKLLVIKVDKFHYNFSPESPFENCALRDNYAIQRHQSKRIPGVQSTQIAFYLHPLKSASKDEKRMPLEIQLIVQKKFTFQM